MAHDFASVDVTAADTFETAYTTTDTDFIVSKIIITNRTASAITAKVAIVPFGEARGEEHYYLDDVSVPAQADGPLECGTGLTLKSSGDMIDVEASSANVTVHVHGDYK